MTDSNYPPCAFVEALLFAGKHSGRFSPEDIDPVLVRHASHMRRDPSWTDAEALMDRDPLMTGGTINRGELAVAIPTGILVSGEIA